MPDEEEDDTMGNPADAAADDVDHGGADGGGADDASASNGSTDDTDDDDDDEDAFDPDLGAPSKKSAAAAAAAAAGDSSGGVARRVSVTSGRRNTLSAGRQSVVGDSLAESFRRATHSTVYVQSLTPQEKLDMQTHLLELPIDEQLGLLLQQLAEPPPRKFWHIRCLCAYFSPNLFHNGMSDQDIQGVVDQIRVQRYKPGDVVFKQGQLC